MTTSRRAHKRVLRVVMVGFSLTILFLLGSGYFGIQAMKSADERSETLFVQHVISTRLIDEIQGGEAGLSGLFYALAEKPPRKTRAQLLRDLDGIEAGVSRTLQAARNSSSEGHWPEANAAVDRFVMEVRQLLATPAAGSDLPASLERAHEVLISEISNLVAANYQIAIDREKLASEDNRRRMSTALVLLGLALALSVICAISTIRIARNVFRRADWQAGELTRLSGHVLETQEEMLHRFSRELHDEFGQSLTAIEANLAAVPAESPEVAARIEDCVLLTKDLMNSVRESALLMRPSALDDFGLVPSLQGLAESFGQRTGIAVRCRFEFEERLPGELETHLFRIAQEALTNVARHSGATAVDITLTQRDGNLRLIVEDNGTGLKPRPGNGLGMAGMQARMRVAGGELFVQSNSHGVRVAAEVALDASQRAKNHSSLVGG